MAIQNAGFRFASLQYRSQLPPLMPYLNLYRSLVLLRIAIALVFFMHALVRVLNNTIGIFGHFLEQKHFIYGTVIVWILTCFEILGAILLAIGRYTKPIALAFIFILVVGIILIHYQLGWFVGEHGTGGIEYSFILIMALITIIAAANKKQST